MNGANTSANAWGLTMKVDRNCPRCRAHLYHFVHAPKTDDDAKATDPDRLNKVGRG